MGYPKKRHPQCHGAYQVSGRGENIYCIAVGYEQHQSDWYILVSRFPKIHSIF